MGWCTVSIPDCFRKNIGFLRRTWTSMTLLLFSFTLISKGWAHTSFSQTLTVQPVSTNCTLGLIDYRYSPWTVWRFTSFESVQQISQNQTIDASLSCDLLIIHRKLASKLGIGVSLAASLIHRGPFLVQSSENQIICLLSEKILLPPLPLIGFLFKKFRLSSWYKT